MIEMELEHIQKLNKDLKAGIVTLETREARYLVDTYYTIQGWRITAASQERQMSTSGEPHAVISWMHEQARLLENEIKKALNAWTDYTHMGQWAKGICGIGPVLAAGLEAHIDITKAPTVGHIYSFAGLVPGQKWEKGQKRPWNADLKSLCWMIGECFVKVMNRENDIYGNLYKKKKAELIEMNEQSFFVDDANERLSHVGKNTEAYKYYKEGKLPPGHIHARAKRYAVKIFLSHWHYEAYKHHYGKEPAAPYAIAILGHAHWIKYEDLKKAS